MSVDEILLRSRFMPLQRILAYDVFNTGFNGWMTLLPNFTEYPDFDVPPTLVNKDQWPPVMLSSATYRYPRQPRRHVGHLQPQTFHPPCLLAL